MTATSPVLKQIAGLPKRSQEELKALWREYFRVEPPAYRRGFLVRGLAHRLQELTYGGLKPVYQARLDAMIAAAERFGSDARAGGNHHDAWPLRSCRGAGGLADERDAPVYAHAFEFPYLSGRASYPPGIPPSAAG
jgi:Protein of unknown function (DUF2924)